MKGLTNYTKKKMGRGLREELIREVILETLL